MHFPIENRWVRQDDIYMSPAYGRDAAYIACHVYNKKEFREYFDALEPIFKSYQGRPHWGKMHNFTKEDVVRSYPKFIDFLNFQKQQDPDKLFVNPYVQQLFGL